MFNSILFFLGIISCSIIGFLAGIHFYWAIGGKWDFASVLPTKESGDLVLKPKTMDSVIVGFGLVLVACFYALKSNLFVLFFLSNQFLTYGVCFFAIIFFIRALGDFKYVGFGKKIKNTNFAKNDTLLFSPLCFMLSIIGFVIAFN